MPPKTTKRSLTWDFSDLFKSDDDPAIQTKRAEVTKATNTFVKNWKERKDYLKDPKILRKALDEYENWARFFGFGGNEAYYFSLRFTQNQTDTSVKAKSQLAEDFSKDITNKIRFFELNIAKIPESEQQKFLKAKELESYKHFLEMAFAEAKYLLTEREEMIMSMKSSTAYSNWVDMTETFLVKEERNGQDFSTLLTEMSSKDKKARDKAAEGFNDILNKYAEVAEVELNNVINDKKTNDIIRNVPRPDITRHMADDMDSKAVDTMLEAVEECFGVPARYYKLKAKLLGVKKLEYHERNVEYGSLDKKYTWDESVELIRKVYSRLDSDFLRIFDTFLSEGRFDVYPAKGKASGAFCAHYLISQPTYILLNHTGTLRDVLTIAHEVGHGINNELIREKQNALHFGTPTSTAEVASTFMEDFVLEELMKEASDELKLTLGVMKMDEEVSTIFRQVAAYRFEQELHNQIRKEGYLSKEAIGKIFQKHMKAYMGTAVEQSPGSENWWIYWSHIRNYFYVYSYAGGLLISKNLQQQVRNDSKNIKKVKEFLSAGRAESPKDIFKKLGIDMTKPMFWKDGLRAVDEELKRLEALAKRMKKV